jgi:very-short-patch-repair endonuclease
LAAQVSSRILQRMSKAPRIPPEFKLRPFSLDEARDAGLTRHALSGKAWQRIGAGLYRWNELPDDPWLTLSAWRRVLPAQTVFAGASAAWLHGIDPEPAESVEVVLPPSSSVRTRPGLIVRHGQIPPADRASVRGLRVTSLHLTLATLCLRRPAGEALVALDTAVRLGLADSASLCRYATTARGRPGTARMRSLALLAAAAESPMETRLRWLLIQARLPRPQVQANLLDAESRFVGRADIYYPEARLVIEFDGGNHRERMVQDNRRQNLIINGGYRVLRFTAVDVYKHANALVAQVRSALESG